MVNINGLISIKTKLAVKPKLAVTELNLNSLSPGNLLVRDLSRLINMQLKPFTKAVIIVGHTPMVYQYAKEITMELSYLATMK